MKPFFYTPALFLATICLIFSVSPVFGEEAGDNLITFRFFDSATGAAVSPSSLTAVKTSSNDLIDLTNSVNAESAGKAVFTLPDGQFRFFIQAKGYERSGTYFDLYPDRPLPEIAFHLDPQIIPEQLSQSNLNQQRKADATLVCGFVSDKQSGELLAGVKIINPVTGESTLSDANGYFSIYLPNDQLAGQLLVEKNGYITRNYTGIELWPNGDWQYTIRMTPGAGSESIDQDKSNRGSAENCADCGEDDDHHSEKSAPRLTESVVPPILAFTIRVGRNCTSTTNCPTVEVYTMSTYAKRVLPAEWFSCWGSLANGGHTLRAGAVAIRTYASWHINHPLTSNYDICDYTACQFFGDTQTSNCNVAVDATTGYVMINSSDDIPRAEYSAENNNSGCGNGFSGTGTSTAPCINDPVCVNQTMFGHGRGLCQWGSARWANGTFISTSSPCNPGPAHNHGAKDWMGILDHYYPNYTLIQGIGTAFLSTQTLPNNVSPGETFSIFHNIDNLTPATLLLGASIAPAFTFNYIDDSANDVAINVSAGINTVSRDFYIPDTVTVGGVYDVLSAIWFDADDNGMINTGDVILDLERFNGLLTMNVTGIEPQNNGVPTNFLLGQNYPNPFNPETQIEFSLPVTATAELKVFDALGREIATLVNESLAAGSYTASWQAQNLAAGVYFYRLNAYTADGKSLRFSDTKQLILAK